MKNKKLIMMFICMVIFNIANGMELVKDVVKHEVIPAGLIMATGAALGALSHSLIWKIHGESDLPKRAFKGAINGVLASIPSVCAVRFSQLDFSWKKFVICGGVASVPYLLAGLSTSMIKGTWDFIQSKNPAKQNKLSTYLSKQDYDKSTKSRIFIADISASILPALLLGVINVQ
jgi:hypothetical protein